MLSKLTLKSLQLLFLRSQSSQEARTVKRIFIEVDIEKCK